ncbi:hypothetical protein [Ornithinicoccus halotolerans]|uniref:hypothetical protein n=1 Tax=Ornithinicoccus halotolerans TaxID=1748220 RepID=UPI001295C65B|nr:hypothetical protein [Ornithinicoccus halotolerans]
MQGVLADESLDDSVKAELLGLAQDEIEGLSEVFDPSETPSGLYAGIWAHLSDHPPNEPYALDERLYKCVCRKSQCDAEAAIIAIPTGVKIGLTFANDHFVLGREALDALLEAKGKYPAGPHSQENP